MRTPDISGPVDFVTVIMRLWAIVTFSNKGKAEDKMFLFQGCMGKLGGLRNGSPPAVFCGRDPVGTSGQNPQS